MAAGGSFEQWQKDVFFLAAEEVQESTDTMESVYRSWIRNRRDGFDLEALDELARELKVSLGTAKWQLEEFEKAIKLSDRSFSSDENTIARHKQFVSAIGNKISWVEKGLNDSLIEEGKQRLCWVQLDKEEQDDLANFLSGTQRDDRQAKHVDQSSCDLMRSFKGTVMINNDKRYVVEVAEKDPYWRKNDAVLAEVEQLHEQTRLLSSPNIGGWKIVIADEDTDKGVRPQILRKESGQSGLLRSAESTSKWREFRNNLWKAKNEDHHHLRHGLSYYLDLKGVTRFIQSETHVCRNVCAKGISGLTERSQNYFSNSSQGSNIPLSQNLVGRVGGFQRQMVGSQQHMHFIRYVWITFLLLLSVVLVVPFVLYSA